MRLENWFEMLPTKNRRLNFNARATNVIRPASAVSARLLGLFGQAIFLSVKPAVQ